MHYHNILFCLEVSEKLSVSNTSLVMSTTSHEMSMISLRGLTLNISRHNKTRYLISQGESFTTVLYFSSKMSNKQE